MATGSPETTRPLKPGSRRYLGYGDWLISQEEADFIRSNGGIATVDGEPVTVHFVQKWEAWQGEIVNVPGTAS